MSAEPEEDPDVRGRRTHKDDDPIFPPDMAGGSDGVGATPRLSSLQEELGNWWRNTAETDFAQMMPKVGEYTASDLLLMGEFLEHWLDLPKGAGMEAACMFYVLGKVARAVSAYREGRLPSHDTLHDLTVYSMMARRIRDTGRWP